MRKVTYLLCAMCALLLISATALKAEDHTIFVVSQGDRTISDIDPLTGKAINTAQLETVPAQVINSWDEQWLFVSEPDAGYIAILNAHTLKEAARISKPEFKRAAGSQASIGALATTPNFKKLFVSVPGGLEEFDQRLLVYNPEYKQPEHKIAIAGQDGRHMLVQGPTDKLYYTMGRDNQVVVVDTNTDKVLKTIPVKGTPMDVAFMIGAEAWVASADGTVSIIDTNKDEVVKTIDTGGKGAAHITTAVDVRFIAVSHDDSGDVNIFQPMTKEIAGTLKVGKGPLSISFTPPGHGDPVRGNYGISDRKDPWHYPAVNHLYVVSSAGLQIADLDKMAMTDKKLTDQAAFIVWPHYMFGDGFMPPREGTSTRVMENDLYTLFDNAMFNYDVSGIHEHRTDMLAVVVGDGDAKIGCWYQDCPAVSIPDAPGGLPYTYTMGRAGSFTGVPRGTLHIEEGATPSPRRMDIFMPKNNYYRQMNPKKVSDFQGKPGYRLFENHSRAWLWEYTLIPGKPIQLPKTDYAIVYLAGGLIRETRDGVPDVEHRLYAQMDTDSSHKTLEAISNRIEIVILEFK